MIVIGNPDKNNSKLRNLVSKLEINEKYLKSYSNFREEIISKINKDMVVLDIGKSMRNDFQKINCKGIKTLDINVFNDYPDIQFDLSEPVEIEKTEIYNKFDAIICLAVLEHVHDPFVAIKNINKMLKSKGLLFGYVPFLYHYHAPDDLHFQDFYRYTKDGLSYLLKDFKEIEIYPVRGRLSSSMHVLLGSLWKKTFERLRFNQFIDLIFSKHKNAKQSGGFNFISKK